MQPLQLPERLTVTGAGDAHQRHVAAVGLNVRAQLVDGIDHALPLRIVGRLRRQGAGGCWARIAASASSIFHGRRYSPAGLGVVDHLLEGGQAVVHHGPANMSFVDAEAFTDQLALLMLLLKAFAAKMGDSRTQRLRPITEQCIFSGGRPSR